MTENEFGRIEQLFHQAMGLPLEVRESFLKQLDSEPDAIRQEVLNLIRSTAAANRIFDDRAWMGRVIEETADPRIGGRLGAWRIERQLGAGGMGAVYLAERADGQFQMRAALKIVRLGVDSQSMLRRFYKERQILAQLEHTNIARLMDGGITPDNYPFLVMEFIEGERLDLFCRRNSLTLRQKLSLFRKLCGAVRYLHSNLIVHCDLKPSNILVTDAGEPKVLDFGIARLAEDSQTGPQTASTMLFTPKYASPEQVLGKSVSTSCDIYSLGVILYELLTGMNPYGEAERTPLQWIEVILNQDAQPPSEVASRDAGALRGEVDQILLKALRKEARDRYDSVEQFDEDIGRYLDGLPVLAQPQTPAYRMRKFIRRHRGAVAAAAAIVFSLAAGLAATAYQAHIAGRERLRAERRFDDVRRLSRLILFEFHDRVMNLPGSTNLQRELVAKTLDHLERFAREASGDDRLLAELGESYLRLGDVQGNPYNPNLGDFKEALATYSRGLQLLESLPERTASPEIEHVRALLYRSRGALHSTRSDVSQATADLERAEKLFEHLIRTDPTRLDHRAELASTWGQIGDAQTGNRWARPSSTAQVIASYQRSLDEWRNVVKQAPDNLRAQRGVAVALYRIGEQESEDQPRNGLARLGLASSTLDAMPAVERQSLPNRRLLSSIRVTEAGLLASLNRVPEALESYRAALEIRTELNRADPDNQQITFDLATVYRNRGDVFRQSNDLRKAVADYQAASRLVEALIARDPENSNLRELLAESQLLVGKTQWRSGDRMGADRASRRGLALRRQLADAGSADSKAMLLYAFTLLEVDPPSLRSPQTALDYYRKARASGKPIPADLDQWIAELSAELARKK